jgi:hypothetical protein
MVDLIREFKDYFKSNNVEIGEGVSEELINKFESVYKVVLPADYKLFLATISSENEDIYHELATFWPLNRVRRLTDYFSLHEQYYSEEDRKYPMQFSESGGYKTLRSAKLQDEISKKIIQPSWLINEAEYYFIFADYNIEGSHCAIKLKDGGNNLIAIISEHTNTYRMCYESFSELVKNYFQEGAEALL